MNAIGACFERTTQGMLAFIEQDTIVVVLLALLLLLWLKEKKSVDNKGNRLLVYTSTMILLLLFPVTAVLLVIYQTAFYDYAWLWSAVPVLAGIAYMAVVLYEEQEATLTKKKQIAFVGLVLAVLFLCGNQGKLQVVEEKEADAQAHAAEIVECMEQYGLKDDYVLWANSQIMQEVRRQTGEIRLIYGRDMWDEKAGAYDYEEYTEPFVNAYEWMELISDVAQEADSQEMFAILCDYYEGMNDVDVHVPAMLESGANLIVVPQKASKFLKDALTEWAPKYNLAVEEIFTQQYTLYLLK